jgi:hypothetical protein
LGEGAFAGRSESGVVAIVLLVVLGVFAVVEVRGAESGAGTLIGAVGEHEDLPGETGLDDAVGAGEPQRGAVRSGDDLTAARAHHLPPHASADVAVSVAVKAPPASLLAGL